MSRWLWRTDSMHSRWWMDYCRGCLLGKRLCQKGNAWYIYSTCRCSSTWLGTKVHPLIYSVKCIWKHQNKLLKFTSLDLLKIWVSFLKSIELLVSKSDSNDQSSKDKQGTCTEQAYNFLGFKEFEVALSEWLNGLILYESYNLNRWISPFKTIC